MFLKDKDSFLTELSQLTLAAEDGMALVKQAKDPVVEQPSALPGALIGGGVGAVGGGLANYFMQKNLDEKEGKKTHGMRSALIGAALGAMPGAAIGYGVQSAMNGPASATVNGKKIDSNQLDTINARHNGWDSAYNVLHDDNIASDVLRPDGKGQLAQVGNWGVAAAVGSPAASALLKLMARNPQLDSMLQKHLGFNKDVPGSVLGGLAKDMFSSAGNKVKDVVKGTDSTAPKFKKMYYDLDAIHSGTGLASNSVAVNPNTKLIEYAPGKDGKGGGGKDAPNPRTMWNPTDMSNKMYLDATLPGGRKIPELAAVNNFQKEYTRAKWKNHLATVPIGMGLFYTGNAILDNIIENNRGQRGLVVQ